MIVGSPIPAKWDEFPAIGTEDWCRMNHRRATLIHKKNHQRLSPQEQQEFDLLQRLTSEAINKKFPRPPLDLEMLQDLENQLLDHGV